MQRLIQVIETVRHKLPGLRHHGLKETPTRTIVIDPLLEALGWDVRDPDEVRVEYPTVDGKSVDYALKLNKKVVLLVEAKALDDRLDDVKAVTQVVGYAANDGIVWCLLTNGVTWRVYRSVEKCPAPDKLMFEVSLDPNSSEGMTVQQIAHQMWRFSRDEMARGTLDALGEQTFTDGKVRKALQMLMRDPPSKFLKLLRSMVGDEALSPQRIKESLARMAHEPGAAGASSGGQLQAAPTETTRRETRRRQARKKESPYSESHHVAGKPQEAIALYRSLDQLCMSFRPSAITRRYLAKSINYEDDGKCFCSVHVLQGGLRIWLPLRYHQLENPPSFARDVSRVGHWGVGDVELRITNASELEVATSLVRQSFEVISN